MFAEKELEREKMAGILTVGRGSAHPPRLIVIEHGAPAKAARKRPTLALVGKGITFDSGGISIKPAASMDEMKHDMSGGAAVLGALRAAALLDLPCHVIGIVAAAQNMPDGNAYVPGDIIRSAQGKTIEVLNTDAEGRIVLSDALHHADELQAGRDRRPRHAHGRVPGRPGRGGMRRARKRREADRERSARPQTRPTSAPGRSPSGKSTRRRSRGPSATS